MNRCLCGEPITRKAERCNPCQLARLNTDPGIAARRIAGMHVYYADPVIRAKAAAKMARNAAKGMENPANVAKQQANLQKARARLNDPDVLAKIAAKRKDNGRKRSETVMAWCPPEYRDQYRHLTIAKKIKAAEARQMILAIAARNMTPFEKMMEKVRNGAGIRTEPPMPTRVETRTLGGVADWGAM